MTSQMFRFALAITVLFVLIAILARTAEILIFIPIFLVGILVYIAPTLVAQHRGHPQFMQSSF